MEAHVVDAPVAAAQAVQMPGAATEVFDPAHSMPLAVVTPAQLVARAYQQNASIEVLERLMALQVQQQELDERREQRALEQKKREDVEAFNRAFAAFRAEDLHVLKDVERTQGPLSGQKYANLHSFVTATKGALSKHGFGVHWSLTKDAADWIEVTCHLTHTGHTETVSMGGPIDTGPGRSTLQARASTVSYLERYTLKAICGLAERDEDDDGNGGGQNLAPLETFQAASMEGIAALRACYEKHKPDDAWWAKNQGSLKFAAKKADKDREQQP